MSALFGKKDFRKDLQLLILKGDIKGACDYALVNASSYEELGNISEAQSILKTLIELFEANNIKNAPCIETALEKCITNAIDLENPNSVIQNSIKLAYLKIELGKINEAVQLLKVLDLKYKLSTNVLKEMIKIYTSISHFPNALRLIERVLEKEKDTELIRMAGDIHFNTGNFEKALDYFNALSLLEPENEYAKNKVKEIKRILSKTGEEEVAPHINVMEDRASYETGKKIEEVKPSEKLTETQAEEKKEHITAAPLKEVQEVKPIRTNLEDIKDYADALSYIEKGEIKEGVQILQTLALDFEKKDIDIALSIYEKILLIDPTNVGIAKRCSKILFEAGRTKEAIFYLRSAAHSPDSHAKLEALLALKDILKEDINIKKEIFKTYLELNDINSAIETLKWFPLGELNALLEILYPKIENSKASIVSVSKFIKDKPIDEEIKFKYFYRGFQLFYEAQDKIESIKYLIQSHSIRRLPLADYLKVVPFLRELKLPEESDIVASQISSYLEIESDPAKQFELSKTIVSLGVNKPIYFAKHFELANALGFTDVEIEMAKKLIDHNAIQFAELIYNDMSKHIDTLDTEFLTKLGNFLEMANLMSLSYRIYLEILNRDPLNVNALTKTFLYVIEREDESEILAFLEKFTPNASYASIVTPLIEKYKLMQLKNPFEYTYHFTLGFLYFLIERYEEAVALFQFVVRSGHHKALMYLMISICFEKTSLLDFSIKQLENALKEDAIPEVRKEILYRFALLKKHTGDFVSARNTLLELLKLGEYKDAKLLLETLPEAKKIIDIRGEER
uniref:Tetratricopeptide repeat protein n=1 Tax=Caldisericum exile TaxID=693075 RepID=A0A7C4Y0I3_9BACT